MSFRNLNVLIGANASGKSTVLDVLRFLSEGLHDGFERAVRIRGGLDHLGWKGESAKRIEVRARFQDERTPMEWNVSLQGNKTDLSVREELRELHGDSQVLLLAQDGSGWWKSASGRVDLQTDRIAALAGAASDKAFAGRSVYDAVRGWRFFDPTPERLRHASSADDDEPLLSDGANLAARLFALQRTRPEVYAQVLAASRSILGLPLEASVAEPWGDTS